MNMGVGLWGTPDYFTACGTGNTAPPATFAGTCMPHSGNAMMALVLYNSPFPNYREYISSQLASSMNPGTTYTLSFWLSNGTGIRSPWTIRNIGAVFSPTPLSQSGFSLISATPQCEITSNIATAGWTQYTFTVSPTVVCNYITIGAFRPDANNNPVMAFPNPGGPSSVYANYFIDDVELLAPVCNLSVTASSSTLCLGNSPVTLTVSGSANYTWSPSVSLSSSSGSVVSASPSITTVYSVQGNMGGCYASRQITIQVVPRPSITTIPSLTNICPGTTLQISASGGTSYSWQPGGMTTASVSVSPSVNTVYTITALNTQGCTDSRTVSVNLHPAPAMALSALSQTTCPGGSLTFTQSGAVSYSWQPGNISTTASLVTLNPSGSSVYTVTGVNSQGCASTQTRQVTVAPSPTISFVPSSFSACAGSPVTYSVLGAASYTWLPPNVTGSLYTILSPSANMVYTVHAASAMGCTTIATRTLLVTQPPQLTVQSSQSLVCAGGTLNLTASGAAHYTWWPGNLSGPSVTVHPVTATIYTVTGESAGCSSTATLLIQNPLSPTLSSSGDLDCQRTSVQLSVTATSNTYQILWQGPGLNGIHTLQSVSVTIPGVYSVTLTDPVANCSSMGTLHVLSSIGPLPLPLVTSSSLACYPGPPVNMMITTPASLTWFPATEVNPPTGPLVSVNPSVTTTYTVLATHGVCSGSTVITISVSPTPTLNTAAKSLSLCIGQALTLSADGAQEYLWQPGNGIGAYQTVSPLVTMVYTVTGSNDHCSAFSTVSVEVVPLPVLIASVAGEKICVGETATLSASGAEQIIWTAENFTEDSSLVQVSPFTTTTFTATGTSSLGCSSQTMVTIEVSRGPALFAGTSAATVCSQETVSLTVQGAESYTWLPVAQTGSLLAISPSVSTVYTVIASQEGCKSYTTVPIEVRTCLRSVLGVTNAADLREYGTVYKATFTVTVVNASVQKLDQVRLYTDLDATFSYPCTYTLIAPPRVLSSGSGLKTNPLFNGSTEQHLTVPSESELSPGKRDTLSFSVLIDPHGFRGVLKNSVIGYARASGYQMLSDSSNNGFSWDPDGDGDPANNNEMTPLDIRPIELFIPEGFSPDGDGLYDFFVIKGLNGRRINITIFNRWGDKVYEKDNYDNSWDGRSNVNALSFGQGRLPESTYYYVVEFQDGEKAVKTGFVVLKY
jgi:gliding motility-associated-like protein